MRRFTEAREKKQPGPEQDNPEDELKFVTFKTNRANVKKTRVLCVRTNSLVSYDPKGGKTRVLSLSELNTVERSPTDKRRVTLTFTTRPKTVFNFADAALREKFLGRVLKLRSQLERLERLPFDHGRLRLASMTWNVGGSSPPGEDILETVLGEPGLYDLYIINFQEASKKKEDWCMAIKSFCESTTIPFAVVHTAKLWDMVQMILAKESLCRYITHVESDQVACGVGDVLGNKGGIGTSFSVFDTTICAINCHLAARAERLQQRQANYIRIVQSLQLGMKSCDILNQFNHVIWAGDLNYRVQEVEFQQAVADVKEGNFERLVVNDQLTAEMQALRVLTGFKEGPLDFAPTYRWSRHTAEVSNKREQIPSWTDRVLWKSAHAASLEFESYKGFPEAFGSDHRPVVGTFILHPNLPFDGMELASTSSTVRDRKHLELGLAFPRVTLDTDMEGAEMQATITSTILETTFKPPSFNATDPGVWEGSPIKLTPFIFNKDKVKQAHLTIVFERPSADTSEESRAEIEKGRSTALGYALLPLDRAFEDNAGFNAMITRGGQVVGQFSGKFTAIQKGTIDFEMEIAPDPPVAKEKSGGLFSMFGKTSKVDPTDGLELNSDTPAAELAYVSFPFKSILDKWLFHVPDYLSSSKDRGPSAALHGALCTLKDLFLIGGGTWAKKLPIEVGLIKSTGDCGNVSVGMGLACVFFKNNKDAPAVGLVNCGSGGTQLQLFVKSQGVISLFQEYKPPGGGKGVFSNLRVGTYVPTKENSSDQIKEELKAVVQSAPWVNPKLRERLAKQFKIKLDKLVIPVFGYVRGPLRGHWESCLTQSPHESELCDSLATSMLDSVLGQDARVGSLLGDKSSGYFLKQRQEGHMELFGCRTFYAQYSAATNRKLEPVMTLGVDRASSQWTTIDYFNADDYNKYSVECFSLGMDSPLFAEKFAAGVADTYQNADGLVKLVQRVVDRGNTPVIALNSGCLLNLSNNTRGGAGKKRRKLLTEVLHAYYYNMLPVKVTLTRWSGESVEHEISSSSVAAACAEAGMLLARPDENPRPQFVRVSLEGKDSFLTDLVELSPGSVLVFATAQELIKNPFLLLSEALPRFSKDEAKRPAPKPRSPQSSPTSTPPTSPKKAAMTPPSTPAVATTTIAAAATATATAAPTTALTTAPTTAPTTTAPATAPSTTTTLSSPSSSPPLSLRSMPPTSALALAEALLLEQEEEEGIHTPVDESPQPKTETPESDPVDVAQLEEQQLSRYRALFLHPDFDLNRTYAEVLFDDAGSPEDGEIPLVEHEILEVKNQAAEWWLGIKMSDRKVEGFFPHNFAKVLDLPAIQAKISSRPLKPARKKAPGPPSGPSSAAGSVEGSADHDAKEPSSQAKPSTSAEPPKRAAPLRSVSNAPPPPPAPLPKKVEPEPQPEKMVVSSTQDDTSDKPKPAPSVGECFIKVIATHSCDSSAKTTGGTYLSFTKGEKLTIVKKKSDRWWWAINSKGAKGWVPANHVQTID